MTFLQKIVAKKKERLAERCRRVPMEEVIRTAQREAAPRAFEPALAGPGVSLIAEVKHSSPSKGLIVEDFDPVRIALAYQSGGAAAISVLTEEDFFGGSLDHLRAVKEAVSIPVLRKDFIFDPYQVYESRASGADAILLIAALLTPDQVGSLGGLANELGLAVLAEVHNARELEEVLSSDVGLIGVNNRDLDSFEVDLDTTARLAPLVGGSRTVVSESGIETGDDVRTVCEAGADAILVGESLLRSTDRQQKMAELMSAGRVG